MILATVARSRDCALTFECVISFVRFAGLAILVLHTVEAVPTTARGYSLGIMGLFWGVFSLIAYIVITFGSTAGSTLREDRFGSAVRCGL
jgi:hypothetical protein